MMSGSNRTLPAPRYTIQRIRDVDCLSRAAGHCWRTILVIEVGLVRPGRHQRRITRGILGNEILVDLPFRLEPPFRLTGLPVGRQRPDRSPVFRPVRRHDHFEDPPPSRRIEVSQLASIAARIERVVRTDRYVELFRGVPVEIAEVQRVGSVGVRFPSVKCRTDVLSPGVTGLRIHSRPDCPGEKKDGRSNHQNVLLHSDSPLSVCSWAWYAELAVPRFPS